MDPMNQRIVYPTPDGGVAIVIPTGELPIEEVAKKDVPEGVPYAIVDASEIPEDRTFRAAWSADFPGVAEYLASQAELKAELVALLEAGLETEATLESESQAESAVCEVSQ